MLYMYSVFIFIILARLGSCDLPTCILFLSQNKYLVPIRLQSKTKPANHIMSSVKLSEKENYGSAKYKEECDGTPNI